MQVGLGMNIMTGDQFQQQQGASEGTSADAAATAGSRQSPAGGTQQNGARSSPSPPLPKKAEPEPELDEEQKVELPSAYVQAPTLTPCWACKASPSGLASVSKRALRQRFAHCAWT